jgi:hypothetical protein
MMNMEYAGIALIPLVIGLSEAIKRIGFNAKFIPVIDLILGLVAGIVFLSPGDLKAGIIQGIFIGLSASGLYSGTKNIVQELKQ